MIIQHRLDDTNAQLASKQVELDGTGARCESAQAEAESKARELEGHARDTEFMRVCILQYRIRVSC